MNRQEKVALVLNHTEPENFERMRNVLQIASEEQLDQFVRTAQAKAAKNVAELEMQTAQAKLMLAQNGLMQSEQNWLILQSHLGDYYTFEKARNLILSNATVRAGLVWRQGVVPFGEHNRQIVEQQAAEAREQAEERAVEQQTLAQKEAGYRLFVAAAHEATIRGISSAPNRANWSLVLDVLYAQSKPLTMENIIGVILQGSLKLAQDDTAQVHQQERKNIYASIRPRLTGDPHSDQIKNLVNTMNIVDLRLRIKLCEEIANNYSRSPWAINEEFRKQMVSVSRNHELQARVSVIRENRRLRSLSPAELKEEAAQGRQPQQSQDFPVLGPEFAGADLVKMCGDKDNIRHMIKHYGREQIDRRLAEYQRALKSTGWSHRIATEELERLKETV